MSTENPTFTFPADPDYGIWTRTVERAMEALEDQGVDLEFYPAEGLIAEIVADLGLTSPDEGAQMQILEDELIAIFGDE